MIRTDQEKSKRKPLISVVVAVKNGASHLQRCIDSFVHQSFPAKELVIIDGGSEDGTVDIIRKNNNFISFWESSPDRGIAHAWNKALMRTKGDWIIFIGADDCFHDNRTLEKYIALIKPLNTKRYRIVYGRLHLISKNGNVLSSHGEDWRSIKSKFFTEKMMIPHQACFHHHSVFQEKGTFDEQFEIASDYDLLVRTLKNEDAYFLDDLIVSKMASAGISTRISSLSAMQIEFNNVLLKNGFSPNLFKSRANLIAYKMYSFVEIVYGKKIVEILADFVRIISGKTRFYTVD